MELDILKRKISTFRGEGGRVRITDDGLMMEILAGWEQWKGPILDFYRAIGVSQKGMASILGKAKKLRREGRFPVEEFKEIKLTELPTGTAGALMSSDCIEMSWENGKVIRFSRVDQLVDFLKKVA